MAATIDFTTFSSMLLKAASFLYSFTVFAWKSFARKQYNFFFFNTHKPLVSVKLVYSTLVCFHGCLSYFPIVVIHLQVQSLQNDLLCGQGSVHVCSLPAVILII